MKFIKMQGIGNDYVYVDCFKERVDNPSEVAKLVSNRNFGVGSDGLILIAPSEHADVRMDMYNMDGSRGKMCGNGSRCVAKYAYDKGYVKKKEFVLETLGGDKNIIIYDDDNTGITELVRVDMGEPKLYSELPEKIIIDGKRQEFVGIDVGNPHAVYVLQDKRELIDFDMDSLGRKYEYHERFPEQVNSEFIYIKDRKNIYMRVWERGSGETMACGTGATASAYAAILLGKCDDKVKLHLKGGVLDIEYNRELNRLFMTGKAAYVFEGDIDIEKIKKEIKDIEEFYI